MNISQPPDQTIPLAANSSLIANQTTLDSFNKKKRKSAQKDHQKQHRLIHQLIQPPRKDGKLSCYLIIFQIQVDDEDDSEQEENEESTEEQLAHFELKKHKKMKLNNSEEHNISDTDEDNKNEVEEEDATEEEDDDEEESNEIDSSQETPSENENQDELREDQIVNERNRNTPILLENKLKTIGQEKEQEEHSIQSHSQDSVDGLRVKEDQDDEEEEDEDDDEDEDYVITEEDLAQHRNDKILNGQWSEDTMKKLEIDELDEPLDEDCDAEGFDVEEVMNDDRKKKYIENLMECLPPYMYCITLEDKRIFFEKLNKEFQRNLEEANKTVVSSHEKKVNFDFASAQVIEFDLNKKVKNISKLPIIKGVEEIPA